MSSKSQSTPSKSQTVQQSSLFILHYKTRRVLVHLPKDYDALQLAIRRYFPEIPADHRVSYHTTELDISNGALVEIVEDVWDAVIPLLKSLTVESEPRASTSSRPGKRPLKKTDSECESSCDESNAPKPPPKKPRRDHTASSRSTPAPVASAGQTQITKKKLTLNIHQFEGGALQIQCSPSLSIRTILSAVHTKMGLETDAWRAQWKAKWLVDRDHTSIGEYGIMDGDDIWLFRNQIGGKPVIYLFSPMGTEVDASVKLELVPEWHFSAIYPVVSIGNLSSGRQALQWDVEASSDGTLLEKNTRLKVSYLFWEAEALVPVSNAHPSYSPHSSNLTDEAFVPTHARLDPSNSVVLEVANVTPYLDNVLKALGLHTEARTSFITYWLPSFLKHTHIALRFLPQSAYEHAAPLYVSPQPDVVLRVFMLFKGLKEDDMSPGSQWMEVKQDVSDVERWKSIVGVDESRSLVNGSLFRVLEWGGMEVMH